MKTECRNIISEIPELTKKIDGFKDMIITNTVMINEVPAPTFQEYLRAEWMINRLSEFELQNCSLDEKSNALGIIPGESGDRNILVVAHLDSLFPDTMDHSVSISMNSASGPGVGDNSLGVAALTTLPQILSDLDIHLDSNIILMGTAQSLGHGDIEGIRFFLNNYKRPIAAGLCIEGVKLGRISYSSLGMLRGRITCTIPEEYDWTKFDSVGAIVVITEIINRLLEMPLPRKPKTSIVLGSIEGGTAYNTLATKAILRFEIRSESDKMVEELTSSIRYLTEEITSRTGALLEFQEVSRRKFGGMDFSHPMNVMAREILKKLEVTPRLTPSTSELSAFIDRDIPALTIGLTDGENMGTPEESIHLNPISKGIAQLISLIKAIDMGCCDA